jgi:hypothetical protein
MLLLQAWLLFPALLALLSLGFGLLVDRISGARLPGALLIPTGLAAIIVLARAAMTWDLTAELATPLVVTGAIAGLAVGRARLRRPGIDPWAAAAAVAVFAMFAAPVVLGGSASFAGYTILGDTAVHFVLADRIASHGSSVAGLDPSSYRQTLEAYFGSGYPLGAHAALAAVRPLAFVDVAWAFQPFLAFVAAALALTLVGLLQGVVESSWRRAAVAAVAAQPALVYAFAMQGSVKELVTLWLVALFTALAVGRHVVPLAVAAAAGVAAIGIAVAAWLGPVLLVGLLLVARAPPRELRRTAGIALGFCLLLGLLCLPTLLDLGDYLDVTRTVVTAQEELGNLFGPLNLAQVFGVWLTGDYRMLPKAGPGIDKLELTYALIGLVAVAALFGSAWLARRRALAPLLFLVVSLVGLVYVTRTGSPWADAKALAIASPAVLLVAALGPIALEARGARLEALGVAAALAIGVLASNALVYHDASLAPRERLAELQDVADRTAGRGPLLYTEFEEMAKHFLRDSDPVGAAEAFSVPGLTPVTHEGGLPSFGHPVELSALRLEDIQRFRVLVLRREPLGASPPPEYTLEWSGRYYEIWSRRGGGGRTVAQETLRGDGGRGDCRLLRRVASHAGDGSRLEATRAPVLAELSTAERALPAGWARRSDDPSLVQTVGPGVVRGSVELDQSGPYELWLRGSFGREVEVRIDGQRAGSARDELAQPANWLDLGSVELSAGRHRVELVRSGGDLAPGNGDGPRSLGSLVVRRREAHAAPVSVPPREWHRLCGRRLLSASALAPAS